MAVDKLVDSTQLDTDLTSVANAIRTKGGTSAQLAFPSGFVSAIDAIPTGGGEPKWDVQNPLGTWLSEIPDLTQLSRSTPVLYFVADTSRSETVLYGSVGIRPSQAGTIETGHLSNGAFVVDDTESVSAAQYWTKALNKNGERFWVFRYTSSTDIARIDPTNQLNPSYQPIVAFYGYLPSCTNPAFLHNNENCMIIDIKGLKAFPINGTYKTFVAKLSGMTVGLPGNAFYNNKNITEIDASDWNINASTTMAGAFRACDKLRKLKLGTHNTSSVTTIQNFLAGDINLNHLDISGLDLSGVSTTTGAFDTLTNLTDIDGWTAIPVSYSICTASNGAEYLTHESLMKVINSLPTVQTTQTLTIRQKNLDRLSAEEIAIATAKGWTVA